MRYDYIRETDEYGADPVEFSFDMGKAPPEITFRGEKWVQAIALSCPTVIMKDPPPQTGKKNGSWQVSKANGCMTWQVKRAREVARALGAPDIDYAEVSPGMSAAVFENKAQKDNWLRAHHRVDHDSAGRAPCPGDFEGKELPNLGSDPAHEAAAKRKMYGKGV